MSTATVYPRTRMNGTTGWLFFVGRRDAPSADGGYYDNAQEAITAARKFADEVFVLTGRKREEAPK